nr:hypothetical protein 11 [Saccharospirillaceae bacterium]
MNNLFVNRLIIHELKKEQHTDEASVTESSEVLKNSDNQVTDLVNEICRIYGKKDSRSYHGRFSEGDNIFKNALHRYTLSDELDQNPEDQSAAEFEDERFLRLSITALNEIKNSAQHQTASTGGYLVFAEYTENDIQFFISAMIKKKKDVTIESLKPKEIIRLDFSKINQAMRVNVNDYKASLVSQHSDSTITSQAQTEEPEETPYLSFIGSIEGGRASGYFIVAMGCERQISSRKATDTVITESENLFQNDPELTPNLQTFKKELLDYLDETTHATLDYISEIIRRNIPVNYSKPVDETVDDFVTKLNGDEFKVPFEFNVNKERVSKSRLIRAKAETWSLEFEKSSIGTDPSADIVYDPDERRVIINNLPQDAIDEIETVIPRLDGDES